MRYTIEHYTRYRYSRAVCLDPHMVRLHPRQDRAQALLSYNLSVTPAPAGLSNGLDLENNDFTLLWFKGQHACLDLHCRMEVDTRQGNPFAGLFQNGSERLPMATPADQTHLWHPYLILEEGSGQSASNLAEKLLSDTHGQTLAFLLELNNHLFGFIEKITRLEPGLQSTEETLTQRSGACRDLAWVFMQVCRRVGIPARYVSGYQEGDPENPYGDLHAWADVYLPGFGWRGYDPTNGLAVADRHIVLAAAADPADTSPVAGAFYGSGVTTLLEHEIHIQRGNSDQACKTEC